MSLLYLWSNRYGYSITSSLYGIGIKKSMKGNEWIMQIISSNISKISTRGLNIVKIVASCISLQSLLFMLYLNTINKPII